MSTMPSDLDRLAYEYDRLEQEADRLIEISVQAKAAAELAEARKNAAQGKVRDALAQSGTHVPCTIAIAIAGTSRLLTVYEDGYGLCFVVTTAPVSR
jgi:hypothetical protein